MMRPTKLFLFFKVRGLDFGTHFKDLFELTNTIDKLDDFESDIEHTISETIKKCQSELPFNQDLSIWILPGSNSGEHINALNGLGGAYSEESGGIRVVIYPVNRWLETLSYVIAHEYHHAKYRTKRDISRTLLSRVVAEGLADDFANRLFPGKGGPWMSPNFPFTFQEEIRAFNYLLEEKDEDKLLQSNGHNSYLQGTLLDTSMPPYTGYAIAYRLVQGFITSKEISFTDLLDLPPEIILEESIYKPSN